MLEKRVRRRKAIAATGTIALGGLAFIPESSSAAEVSVDSFDVRDAQLDSGVSPELNGKIAYAYDIPGGNVSSLRFALEVGDSQIAEQTISTASDSLESEVTLSGRLAKSDEFVPEDFDVDQQQTFDLSVTVVFEVLDRNGETLAGDHATDSATLTVGQDGTASVGGVVAITATE